MSPPISRFLKSVARGAGPLGREPSERGRSPGAPVPVRAAPALVRDCKEGGDARRTVDACAARGYFHQDYAYETFTGGADLPIGS